MSFEDSHYILLFRYIYGAQLIPWFCYSIHLHVNRNISRMVLQRHYPRGIDAGATPSAGATMEQATSRAQQAADTMARWARRWKMKMAGQKTQALVLSQWYRDPVGFSLRVDGAEVKGSTHLKLLGVTFDRLLHFGEHCARIRKKVKPRIAHLRTMTSRSWGLREQQLRVVAKGYIRGAMEHAAAAWLPATPPGHVTQLDRELRSTARVITGCPRSTPVDPLMAEAGLAVAQVRRGTLAARMLCLARSLPTDDPLRQIAEENPPRRLKTTTGWRRLGREALRTCGLQQVPVEERLHVMLPPWQSPESVTVRLDLGRAVRRDRPQSSRRRASGHTTGSDYSDLGVERRICGGRHTQRRRRCAAGAPRWRAPRGPNSSREPVLQYSCRALCHTSGARGSERSLRRPGGWTRGAMQRLPGGPVAAEWRSGDTDYPTGC